MLHSLRRFVWLAMAGAVLVSAARAQSPTAVDDTDPPIDIRFKRDPGRVTWYTIENQFVDSAEISGEYILGYSNTVFQKRTIAQSQPADTNAAAGVIPFHWTCIRYEAWQRGSYLKKADFDSLVHTYPVGPLRKLAPVPESTVTFQFDAITGEAEGVVARPGPTQGPASREPFCDTAKRCLVTRENAERTLFAIGELYLPGRPVRVGDTWTKTRRISHKNFGALVADVTCRLSAVRVEGASRIATIYIEGKVRLAPPVKPVLPAKPAATTRIAGAPNSEPDGSEILPAVPATTSRPTSTPSRSSDATTRPMSSTRPAEPFTIRRAVPPRAGASRPRPVRPARTLDRVKYRGTVRFDLTRGEIVELTFRRELEFGRMLNPKKKPGQPPSRARQTETYKIRVIRFLERPTMPAIAGGPKPPPEPKNTAPPPNFNPRRNPLFTAARNGSSPATRPTTTTTPKKKKATPRTTPLFGGGGDSFKAKGRPAGVRPKARAPRSANRPPRPASRPTTRPSARTATGAGDHR